MHAEICRKFLRKGAAVSRLDLAKAEFRGAAVAAAERFAKTIRLAAIQKILARDYGCDHLVLVSAVYFDEPTALPQRKIHVDGSHPAEGIYQATGPDDQLLRAAYELSLRAATGKYVANGQRIEGARKARLLADDTVAALLPIPLRAFLPEPVPDRS
jgi:hypothetical protein